MGLDMYAYKTREQVAEYGFEEPDDAIQIQYWRKHPNLHGWIEQLYQRKVGFMSGSEMFNCITLRLDLADINALEQAVKNDQLPETTGFFFGTSRPEEKHLDLHFIEVARQAINDGYTVFYDSSW